MVHGRVFWGPENLPVSSNLLKHHHALQHGYRLTSMLRLNYAVAVTDFNDSSGKKKAHKHKSFWPVTPPVTGGVSRPGGQGSKFYVLSSELKEHKSFCPDTRPGGPATGATRKSFMCKSFMCLLSAKSRDPNREWLAI